MRRPDNLNRREQLYAYIIGQIVHNSAIDPKTRVPFLPRPKYVNVDEFYVSTEYKEGDTVMTVGSLTRNPNIFVVGECIGGGGHECVIRDFFTGQICNYSNETYWSIHNLPWHLTISDKHHAIWSRMCRAIKRAEPYRYYFMPHKATFDDDKKEITIITRKKWTEDETTHPPLSYKTLSRDITAIMLKGVVEGMIDSAMAEQPKEENGLYICSRAHICDEDCCMDSVPHKRNEHCSDGKKCGVTGEWMQCIPVPKPKEAE